MRGVNKLNSAQEEVMIKDLQRVVQLNDIQAREILQNYQWNLQRGTNFVLDIQNKGSKVEEQFNKYLQKNQTFVDDVGTTQFCQELGIDIMDPIILYISYIFKSEAMGIYTKFDFLYGFNNLKCQSTNDLRKLIPKLRDDFNKIEVLKLVYKYCFDFVKQKNRKDIDLQFAKGLWETLLRNQFPIMQKFLQYVDQLNEKEKKSISRDTYYMIWEFCIQIGNDLTRYDYKTGAWPTFLDAFYFYVHPEHKNQQQ